MGRFRSVVVNAATSRAPTRSSDSTSRRSASLFERTTVNMVTPAAMISTAAKNTKRQTSGRSAAAMTFMPRNPVPIVAIIAKIVTTVRRRIVFAWRRTHRSSQ
jgi:hypothetical protein